MKKKLINYFNNYLIDTLTTPSLYSGIGSIFININCNTCPI